MEVIQWRTSTLKNTENHLYKRKLVRYGKIKLTVDVAAHETYPTGLTVQNHNNGDITGEGSALMEVNLALVDSHDT